MSACANKLAYFVYLLFLFFYIGFSDGGESSTHSGSGQSHFCFFLDDSALVCSFPFVSSLKSAGALPEIQRCGP